MSNDSLEVEDMWWDDDTMYVKCVNGQTWAFVGAYPTSANWHFEGDENIKVTTVSLKIDESVSLEERLKNNE